MFGNSIARLIFASGLGLLTGVALAPTAQALAPNEACNLKPLPDTVASGSIATTPRSLQPQKTWQRQAHPLDIAVQTNTPVADHTVVVCFRWQVDPKTATSPDELKKYQTYVPGDAISSSIPSDKSTGALNITVNVPTILPEPPESPRKSNPVRIVGPYGQDNAFPIGDVRVLLFAKSSDTQDFDKTASIGIIGSDVYCDMPPMGTTATSGVGSLGARKKWQPSGGEFEFTVKAAKQIPTNALIKVCFRWKLQSGDPRKYYDSGPTRLLDRQTDTIKVAATVGNIPDYPDGESGTNNKLPSGIDPRVE
jgi:hypothetical protein